MPGAVTPKHLTQFADELEVNEGFIIEIAKETIERLISSLDETTEEFRDNYGTSPILQRVSKIVRNRCKRALGESLPN